MYFPAFYSIRCKFGISSEKGKQREGKGVEGISYKWRWDGSKVLPKSTLALLFALMWCQPKAFFPFCDYGTLVLSLGWPTLALCRPSWISFSRFWPGPDRLRVALNTWLFSSAPLSSTSADSGLVLGKVVMWLRSLSVIQGSWKEN